MVAYVPAECGLKEGDSVVLELRSCNKYCNTIGGNLLAVIQVSTVIRVKPSGHHKNIEENIMEVEF